jgi:exopolysaccharide biosynthesis polyprenyl glycosylphosphotransferase
VQERAASSVPVLTSDSLRAKRVAEYPRVGSVTGSRILAKAAGIVLDGSLSWLAFCTAYFLRYSLRWVPGDHGTTPVPLADWAPFGLAFCLVALVSLAVSGLYRPRLGRDLLEELPTIARATLIAVGAMVVLGAFLPIVEYSRLVVVYTWIVLVPFLLIGRVLLYGALSHLHGSGWNTRRVLVVGITPLGKMVMQRMLGRRRHGYQLIGFLRAESESPAGLVTPVRPRGDFGRFKCLGGMEDLPRVVREQQIDDVICALPARSHADITSLCLHCEEAGVAVKLVPDLFELSLSRVRMDHLAGIPLIDVRRAYFGAGSRVVKRVVDIILAGAALAAASPLLLVTAIAIKLDSPGPILVRQQRVGKGAREFTFFKFRSMHIGADQQRQSLAEQQGIVAPRIFKDRRDPRRTRVGRYIRKWSIDELPQLFNVLRGDMSMVGPRPPLPMEVALYEKHHFKRFEVPGGITGLWQVSGRSDIESFEEIIIMDTYYVDNWSLALDFRILLRTVVAVLARTGAY